MRLHSFPTRRSSALSLQPIKIPNYLRRNVGLAGGFDFCVTCALGPDQGQLAGVEPIAAAIRTVIHLDGAPGVKKMATEFNAVAARAIAFAGVIHVQPWIALDIGEEFARGFVFFVHALEFEGVEPDAAAATVANIHGHSAHLHLGQFIEASGTFHLPFSLG